MPFLYELGWLLLAPHMDCRRCFCDNRLGFDGVVGRKFFAISSLVLLEYFSKKMASGYVGVVYERYESGGLFVPLKVRLVEFLFPSNHLFYDRSFQYEFEFYWDGGIHRPVRVKLPVVLLAGEEKKCEDT